MATSTERSPSQVEYIMSHESTEVDRLNIQHSVLLDSMKALLFAPIDLSTPSLRILDLATANGLWLKDLKSTTKASHEYIGTDITDQMFPQKLPSSISLTVQSNTEPWPKDWPGAFDLVHERFSLATSGQTPVQEIVTKIIDLAKPGGWVEFVEADFTGGPNSTGVYMAQFGRLVEAVFAGMGLKFDFALRLRGWLEEAGLEAVTEKIFDVPVGAKNPKQEFKEKSVFNFANVATVFSGIGKNMPTPFSPGELEEIPQKLVEEIVTKGGIQRVHVVYGRKPAAKTNEV